MFIIRYENNGQILFEMFEVVDEFFVWLQSFYNSHGNQYPARLTVFKGQSIFQTKEV